MTVSFGAVLLMGSLISSGMFVSERSRQTALYAAKTNLQRLSLAVTSAINRQLLQVDSAILRLPDLFAVAADQNIGTDPQRAHELLQAFTSQTLSFRDLLLVRTDGTVWAAARLPTDNRPLPWLADVNEGLHSGAATIEAPAYNKLTGEWSWYISRPISLRGIGQFQAAAEIPLSNITAILNAVGGLPGLRVYIERPNGAFLASLPFDAREIGKHESHAISGLNAEDIAFSIPTSIIAAPTIAVWRRTLYPDVQVVLTLDVTTSMADWSKDRDHLFLDFALACCLVTAVAGAFYASLRQQRRNRRAELQLEKRFRLVVESAPSAIVMIRANGQIEMVNSQTELVFGYNRAELLGQPVKMLVPVRFRKNGLDPWGIVVCAPESQPLEDKADFLFLRKDGREFLAEIALNLIETEEGTMVLSAIVDISDRKHREDSLHAALKEKEVLLAEIHHRVKNNLQVIQSLLALHSTRIDNEGAQSVLIESQNRIKSMALIHQTLYESRDFAQVDFKDFLDGLLPVLVSSYGINADQIELSICATRVSLPINAAVPCGLIVHELVSNALKHGFPSGRRGQIKIEVVCGPSRDVALSVSDNGVGITGDVDVSNPTTLGLQLIILLADQLGAVLTVSRSGPTRFALQFPIASAKLAEVA
jgi:PAS domain S-box-containing protein